MREHTEERKAVLLGKITNRRTRSGDPGAGRGCTVRCQRAALERKDRRRVREDADRAVIPGGHPSGFSP